MNRTELLTLENGLRVVWVDTPGLHSAILEVFVQIGSKYEKKNEFGISHFMEHMAFKGTKNIPKAKDLFRELDSKGVSYNAATGLESTSYYIKCMPKQLAWASKMLAEIVINPLFEQQELEKERGVVLEEIAMYQDNPMMRLSSDFAELFLNSKEEGCWNILGNKHSLMGIDSAKMHSFRQDMLDAKRVVLVVVGDRNKFIGDNTKILEPWTGWKKMGKNVEMLKVGTNSFHKLVKKDVEQAHFCIGWPGVNRNDPDFWVSRLVDILLTGNFSARLTYLLREELGVAYYVQSVSEQTSEFGMGVVQAGVSKNRSEDIMEQTLREIVGMGDWLDKEMVERSKEFLLGNIAMQMDKVTFWSEFIGQKLLLDNRLTDLDDELQNYRKIGYKNVIDYAKKYLVYKNMSTLLLTG